MRLFVAAIATACLAAAAAAAQPVPWDDARLYERLGLTDQQTGRIQDVITREDKVMREAQAELNIRRAQLERLLIDPDPDMKQVERLLQQTVDWKVRSEMAAIRLRVEVRKIMGEQKWDQLLRTWRALRTRADRPAGSRPGQGASRRPPAPAAAPAPQQPPAR
jgi:hypothetical protein